MIQNLSAVKWLANDAQEEEVQSIISLLLRETTPPALLPPSNRDVSMKYVQLPVEIRGP